MKSNSENEFHFQTQLEETTRVVTDQETELNDVKKAADILMVSFRFKIKSQMYNFVM